MSYRIRTTMAALGATVLSVLLSACNRDVTEPAARALKPGAAAYVLNGATVWNNRTIAIESRQLNSSGQHVCLDIPFGEAFDGQVVNYFPCHYQLAQQFIVVANDAGQGQAWVSFLAKSNPSKCIGIRGGTTHGGEHLELQPCKPASQAQSQTFLVGPGKPPTPANPSALESTICVSAGYPNLAFDVPLPVANSGFVQQFQTHGHSNQLWVFRDIASGLYMEPAASNPWGKC